MRREEISGSSYTPLAWIQPVGICRINIGNLNTAGTISLNTEFKFRQISHSTNSKIIAISYPNAGLQVYTNNISAFNQGAYINISTGIDYTVYTTTTSSQRTITISSNTQIQTFSRSITDNCPLYLFSLPGNLYPTDDRFYYFKVWRNDVLERDLVPVLYRNEACIFDRVYNNLYFNEGTGYFNYSL